MPAKAKVLIKPGDGDNKEANKQDTRKLPHERLPGLEGPFVSSVFRDNGEGLDDGIGGEVDHPEADLDKPAVSLKVDQKSRGT